MGKIRIIFLGTPEIAAKALQAFLNDEKFEIKLVVTGNDKQIGRKHSNLAMTPVANLALKYNLPLLKTDNVNNEVQKLSKYNCKYLITCAFGQFLNKEILNLPTKLALNIHPSLLPTGRGGAPLHWAIINQQKESGISIIKMEAKMDSGAIFFQTKFTLANSETYDSLLAKVSNLLEQKLATWIKEIDNKPNFYLQNESDATYWLNIKKNDSKIDFTTSAEKIEALIRGLNSKPYAYFNFKNKVIKVKSAKIITDVNHNETGKILNISKEGILISTDQGAILLTEIIIEGKKAQTIKEMINGTMLFKTGEIING